MATWASTSATTCPIQSRGSLSRSPSRHESKLTKGASRGILGESRPDGQRRAALQQCRPAHHQRRHGDPRDRYPQGSHYHPDAAGEVHDVRRRHLPAEKDVIRKGDRLLFLPSEGMVSAAMCLVNLNRKVACPLFLCRAALIGVLLLTGCVTQETYKAQVIRTNNFQRQLAEEEKRSEEHTSELQSLAYLVCRLLLEKKKQNHQGAGESQNKRPQ